MSANSLSSRPETACPLRMYSPLVGVSRHPMRFIRVDFPEPEGPMIAR